MKLTGHLAIRCVAALLDHGRLSEDDIIAFLADPGESREWDAHGVMRAVAPRLTDAALHRACAVARERGLNVAVFTVQLIERGAWKAALRDRPEDPWSLFAVLPTAMATEQEEGRRAWIGEAIGVLESLLDAELVASADAQRDPCDTGTLVLLRGARHLTPHLPAMTRGRLLDHLERQVAMEAQAGCYDELDYPYGTPDPTLELAHVLAVGGAAQRGAARLAERHERQPRFLNDEEVVVAGDTVTAFDAPRRETWWPRLREWARTTDADSGPGQRRTEVRWLLGVLRPGELDRHVGAMVGPDLRARGLREVLCDARLSADVRSAACIALVESLLALADGLHRASDPMEVRQHRVEFRAGAAAAGDVAAELTLAQHDAISRAAQGWSRWVTAAPQNAGTDELATAIKLARDWRPAIEPVLPILCRRHAEVLATHPGWETLMTPDEVERMLTRLLPA